MEDGQRHVGVARDKLNPTNWVITPKWISLGTVLVSLRGQARQMGCIWYLGFIVCFEATEVPDT